MRTRIALVIAALSLVLSVAAATGAGHRFAAHKVTTATVSRFCAYVDLRHTGQSAGDVNVFPIYKHRTCIVGKRGLRGPKGDATSSTGAQGPAGQTGARGATGPQGISGEDGINGTNGTDGRNAFGTYPNMHISNREDGGCDSGNEIWASDSLDRTYVVTPAQDGTGYFVTRYDFNGVFTTIEGAHHPGDCENTFETSYSGAFNGVWTRMVPHTLANFDYNPDVLPSGNDWISFLTDVFGISAADADPNAGVPAVPTTSYEFDYYNLCGDHWRDAFYDGSFESSGFIGDC